MTDVTEKLHIFDCDEVADEIHQGKKSEFQENIVTFFRTFEFVSCLGVIRSEMTDITNQLYLFASDAEADEFQQ